MAKKKTIEISGKKNSRILPPVRQDILVVCDNDLIQAVIVATLEESISDQVAEIMELFEISDISLLKKENLYVLMSSADMEKRGIKRHRFSIALSKLVERGFISRFVERSKPNGPYYYTLNYGAIEEAIMAARRKWKIFSDNLDMKMSFDNQEKNFIRVEKVSDSQTDTNQIEDD